MKKNFRLAWVALFVVAALSSSGQALGLTPDDNKPIYLNRSEFIKRVIDFEKHKSEWVYEGKKPAIVDFYADWCGPCRKVAPALEELASEYAGKVYIYKVNIDKEPELAGLFNIQNIPAFLVIPMKGKPTLSTGASSNHTENKARFKKIIDEELLKK